MAYTPNHTSHRKRPIAHDSDPQPGRPMMATRKPSEKVGRPDLAWQAFAAMLSHQTPATQGKALKHLTAEQKLQFIADRSAVQAQKADNTWKRQVLAKLHAIEEKYDLLLEQHAPAQTGGDPLARARARGIAQASGILAQPDMLSADEIAQRLRVSRETVNTWRKRSRLLALQGAKRGYRFPDWQISPTGTPLPALSALFGILGPEPWSLHRFLIQRHPALDGRRAFEALHAGDTDAVLDLARAIATGAMT